MNEFASVQEDQTPTTLIGFDVTDDIIEAIKASDRSPSTQTQLFARRLTQMIYAAFPHDTYLISSPPVSVYPIWPKRLVRARPPQEAILSGVPVTLHLVGYINTRTLRLATRFITSLRAAIRRGQQQRGGLVVVYSVHLPFMFAGLVLARIAKATSVAVWTDPPGVIPTSHRGPLRHVLSSIEKRLCRFVMRRFDLAMVLTEQLGKDFAPDTPRFVVEGLIDSVHEMNRKEGRSDSKTVVTYTGGLSRRYGLEKLTSAVRLLPPDSAIELHIYGHGDFADELASMKDQRIVYHGAVAHERARRAQMESDFLISVRDSQEQFTAHTFPSKLLEYLASGTPTISSNLPGFTESARDCMLLIEDYSIEAIRDALLRAEALSGSTRKQYAEAGLRFARKHTPAAVGPAFREFILANDGTTGINATSR